MVIFCSPNPSVAAAGRRPGSGSPYDSFYGGVQEIVTQCEPKSCYVGCRMSLVGGGRCTRGGCLCYAAFFNADGSPTAQIYPQDRQAFVFFCFGNSASTRSDCPLF